MASYTSRDLVGEWQLALGATPVNEPKAKKLSKLIKASVEEGRLSVGAKLPSQRFLARCLGVSLQLISSAYRELERQGYINCTVGSGCYVMWPVTIKIDSATLGELPVGKIDLSTIGVISTRDHEIIWQETCSAMIRDSDPEWIESSKPIVGHEAYLEAGRQWLAKNGVVSDIEDILLTNGCAHGVYIALASFAHRDDVVVCDGITDVGVIGASQILGFTLKGLEVDCNGLSADHFEYICSHERIAALVCTPNLSNPTATVMSVNRRLEIAKVARRFGVLVIENDVFGPLLGAPRLPTIHSHLPEQSIYSVSMGECLFSGLRIGYLTASRQVLASVRRSLKIHGWVVSSILAGIASRWVFNGTAERLLSLQRSLLAKRQEFVKHVLGAGILGRHRSSPFVWVTLPPRITENEFIRLLGDKNIALSPTDLFVVPGVARPSAFRISISGQDDDELHYAMWVVHRLLEKKSS